MSLFDDKVKTQLKGILEGMKDRVNLLFFTQEFECNTCRDTRAFVTEFIGLTDKIGLTVFDLVKDKDKAEFYMVNKIPCIVVLDSKNNDTGVKFYGLPGGYEINSFLKSLMEVSGVREELPADTMKRISAINKDVHLQVFVTLSCPYCPGAVTAAHRLAMESSHIRADMVESSTFTPFAVKYQIQSVPKTIINETESLVGAQPIEALLEVIEKL